MGWPRHDPPPIAPHPLYYIPVYGVGEGVKYIDLGIYRFYGSPRSWFVSDGDCIIVVGDFLNNVTMQKQRIMNHVRVSEGISFRKNRRETETKQIPLFLEKSQFRRIACFVNRFHEQKKSHEIVQCIETIIARKKSITFRRFSLVLTKTGNFIFRLKFLVLR